MKEDQCDHHWLLVHFEILCKCVCMRACGPKRVGCLKVEFIATHAGAHVMNTDQAKDISSFPLIFIARHDTHKHHTKKLSGTFSETYISDDMMVDA